MIKRAPLEVPSIRKRKIGTRFPNLCITGHNRKNSSGMKVVNIDESSKFEMTEHEGHTQFITNNDTDINKTAFGETEHCSPNKEAGILLLIA